MNTIENVTGQFEALQKVCFDEMEVYDQLDEFRKEWTAKEQPHVLISLWVWSTPNPMAEPYVCLELKGVFSNLDLMAARIFNLIQEAEENELKNYISSEYNCRELTITLDGRRKIVVSFVQFNDLSTEQLSDFWKIETN